MEASGFTLADDYAPTPSSNATVLLHNLVESAERYGAKTMALSLLVEESQLFGLTCTERRGFSLNL